MEETITIRFPKRSHQKLRVAAAQSGLAMQDFIELAVLDFADPTTTGNGGGGAPNMTALRLVRLSEAQQSVVGNLIDLLEDGPDYQTSLISQHLAALAQLFKTGRGIGFAAPKKRTRSRNHSNAKRA